MDVDRMLEMCRRDQWRADELDWSLRPRALSRDDEEAIVQLFTDMAGIERMAGALFEEQERRAKDPRLKEIFATFVIDEERHADVAERLARFYDVHHYRNYRRSESLERFFPHFIKAIGLLSDDVANSYITGGELILDVALLRSINDYVDDEMSERAMKLINRDESRHIAVDYHMAEHYASKAYQATLGRRRRTGLRERVSAMVTFAGVIYRARPFFKDVFFTPMKRVDPSGKRLREAFKRMQLLGELPGVTDLPFMAFMRALQDLYNRPMIGAMFGSVLSTLAGVEPELMQRLYSETEAARARRMTFDQMSEEALAAKLS